MAEIAVSFVLEQLVPLLREEVNLLRGVQKGFTDIKKELQSIQAFLRDADRMAAAEVEGGSSTDGVKIWVKELREAAFRMEDVIDEYMIYVAYKPQHIGCLALLYKIACVTKCLKPRHRIASEIQDIKESVREIKERSDRYHFQYSSEKGSSSYRGNHNVTWQHDPRMASLFIEEAEVVGFDKPKEELVTWLVKGAAGRTVISVVGMGGLGKTTLAKTTFDNQEVRDHFDSRAWITVSQSYTVEGLLRDMMGQVCKARNEALPQGFYTMDLKSLITQVRQYLQQKRYVIVFDDVWKVEFWDEIQLALPDNNKSSRIIITTRNFDVAEFCKKSSLVHVHKLLTLSPEKARELFCLKAFRFDCDGVCPEELENISTEIVQKCGGLPLAIVAIGGLFSTKPKTLFEWQLLHQNLSLELESNPHLNSLTKILALSYEDLPYYLKPCFLYFGIYPEDYPIRCMRLIRQWISEGFVKNERGKTLEQVAESYLRELIQRSLVQVSKVNFDGNARSSRVHDLLHEMIMRKMDDLSFCRVVNKDDQPISDGMTRRLAIVTKSYDVLGSIGSLAIRSLYIFEEDELPETFVNTVPTKFRLLKVLDFEDGALASVPDNLGNLFHLRYLSLRNTKVQVLPKSIGGLQNLETLDLKQTLVHEIPSEIKKLIKLRHLLVYYRNYNVGFSLTTEKGAQMKDGIGSLTSLQKLYHVEIHDGGVDLIKELRKLRQLRRLGLKHVRREYGHALCASIDNMNHLESLDITAIDEDETIDLYSILSPPPLQRLHLKGRLEKLPDWVPKLQYLVRLRMGYSKLTDDPLKSLKNLPNLLELSLMINTYDGEIMHFQNGGFQRLKVLSIGEMNRLNSILIDEGALPVLEEFVIGEIPQMKEVPFGIHHLGSLKVLVFVDMPNELNQSIDQNEGQKYWIIRHVPSVIISRSYGPGYDQFNSYTIQDLSDG